MITQENIERLASSLLDAYDAGVQVSPVSKSFPELDMVEAYGIAHRISARRMKRGERRVGCKIGFTNRTIWPIYGVTGPMWGPIWNTTLHELSDGPVALPDLPQPRLEPEIIFGLKSAAYAGMTLVEIAECIDWVSHGFEIVFSPFPNWQFTGADTAAAFGLHGALYLGERRKLDAALVTTLPDMRIELQGPENTCLIGSGADVLDGPLHALGFLLDTLAEDHDAPPLTAGQIVTTGTLTDAVPIASGHQWKTKIDGIDIPEADISFL